ncbi:MAG: bifunctional diguanylate cyclase/phosphodiesterase [Cyanobacteria bacterium J06632_22]
MQAHPVFGRSDSPGPFSLWPLPTVWGWSGQQAAAWKNTTHHLVSRIAARVGARSRYHDPFTGLLNRAALEAQIARSMGPVGGPFAVIVVDLDGFGRVNDRVGRSIGDRLLKKVASRLRRLSQAQEGGAIARLESDEFALLVHHSGVPLPRLIERILNSFKRPFRIAEQVFYLTASLGIAEGCLPSRRPADYVRYAEAALGTAKQLGPGQHAYSTVAMSTALVDRCQLEADLSHALIAQQLTVHYQPIIDGATLRICGFEALVRWQHPDRGLVAPAEFIPIAEQSGLIVDIGWWVMAEACAQMVAWQQQFPTCQNFKISVNVANQQFLHPDCTQRIEDILRRTQLSPQNLTLEITESAFLDYGDTTQATLNWIMAQQIGLSIDDFGTGYSSLSYLYRFPVSTVKIDRSFIQSRALACNSGTIVEAIIALGHKLGFDVVAEGVETPEAVDWLRDHRCNQLQGFLFSRPVPSTAATALLVNETSSDSPGAQ